MKDIQLTEDQLTDYYQKGFRWYSAYGSTLKFFKTRFEAEKYLFDLNFLMSTYDNSLKAQGFISEIDLRKVPDQTLMQKGGWKVLESE